MIPSASGLDRAFSCRASCVLPRSPNTGSEDADRGTALHAYAEDIANNVPEETALARVPAEWRATAKGLDVDGVLERLRWDPFAARTLAAEESYAWDGAEDKGWSLGRGLNRDYSSATPGAAVGTADITIHDSDRHHVTIADWKFGHGHVRCAAENMQIRALALYAARHYGAQTATVAIVRGFEDGVAQVDSAEMAAEDLDATADRLQGLARRIDSDRASGDAPATPGEHCRYCRCAAACPEGPLALALATGGGSGQLATSPEGRAKLLRLRILAKRLPDVIDAMLRDAIARGDTSLPDGQVLAIETTERRKVDDDALVYAALETAYGADLATVAAPMERHATLTTIKAAAKLRAPKGKVKETEAELVAACEAAGAVVTSTSEAIVAKRV